MVPSLIPLHPRRPGSFLPFSSSDTVEGSAHGNNPEKRARKASRKNSDMISESGLQRATVLLLVLVVVLVRVHSPPPPPPVWRAPLFGDVQCAEQCSVSPLRDTCTPPLYTASRRIINGRRDESRGWGTEERRGGSERDKEWVRFLSFLNDLMPSRWRSSPQINHAG